jgi:hypothetical protein
MLSLKSELCPGFSDLFSENRFFSEYLSFMLYGLSTVFCRTCVVADEQLC